MVVAENGTPHPATRGQCAGTRLLRGPIRIPPRLQVLGQSGECDAGRNPMASSRLGAGGLVVPRTARLAAPPSNELSGRAAARHLDCRSTVLGPRQWLTR